MNLVDKLLAVDVDKLKEKKTAKFEIKRLSKLIGEPFEVTLQELNTQLYQNLQLEVLDKKGNVDYEKSYDISCKTILKAVVDPDLKNEELQRHFGAGDPLDLVKILFKGNDLTNAAEIVGNLSGFSTEEIEDEEEALKN